MEENLMEKLLTDFSGTLTEIEKLIADKKINEVQRVFRKVQELLREQEIAINEGDDPDMEYDHVVHQLLAQMKGAIEGKLSAMEYTGINGSVYYTKDEVQDLLIDEQADLADIGIELRNLQDELNSSSTAEDRKQEIRNLIPQKQADYENVEKTISKYEAEIADAGADGYTSLTHVDENLKALQDEYDALREEVRKLEEENARINVGTEVAKEELVDATVASERINQLRNRKTFLESNTDLTAGMDAFETALNDISTNNAKGFIDGIAVKDDTPGAPDDAKKLVEKDDEVENKINALLGNARTLKTKIATPGGVSVDELKALLDEFKTIIEDYQTRILDADAVKNLPDDDPVKKFYTKQFRLLTEAQKEIEQKVANFSIEAKDRNREAATPGLSEEVAKILEKVQSTPVTDPVNMVRVDIEIRRLEREKDILTAKTSRTPDEDKRLAIIEVALEELAVIASQKESKDYLDVADKTRIINHNNEIKATIEAEMATLQTSIDAYPGSSREVKLDVEKKAHEVGDAVFKTADIRRELARRSVSRDEFLEFYKQGRDMTRTQLQSLGSREDVEENLSKTLQVFIVDEGEDLHTQLQNVTDNEEAKKILEELRLNIVASGNYTEDQINALGIDHVLSTDEDYSNMLKVYRAILSEAESQKNTLKQIDELNENLEIFEREILTIEQEKKSIELAGSETPDEDAIREEAEKRIDARKDLLKASITPEKDLTEDQRDLLEKWQSAADRFFEHKKTRKHKYTDKDGNEQEVDIDTIETYPEYADDIEFLGVPSYKDNLEYLSMYEIYQENGDPRVFGPDIFALYEQAEARREGGGDELISSLVADKQKYVETFNGIPNPHKVKYENWKTAGSTLKGMKPVDRNLPVSQRIKNGVENVFRFFGIRKPQFSRINEHGEKVPSVAGGIGTLVADGLVIGAVGIATATMGPAVAVAGYAAKGIVTIGNKIRGRIEYNRHKDEIDENRPVINQADKDSREVARKEYYRSKGNNKFVAWFKAKTDRIFKSRAQATEQAIVDGLVDDYKASEETRIKALVKNVEKAKANQIAREKRQRQVAMGANTYNDIVRDPNSMYMDDGVTLDDAKMTSATATIARNAALESIRTGRGTEDVNRSSTVERKSQYVKNESEVEKVEDLDKDAFKVTGIPTSAITEEQIYTGRKQKVDRINKILTIITTGALKFGISALKDQFQRTDVIHHDAETKENVIHHEAEYQEKIIHHDAEYKDVETPVYETQLDTGKTLGDISKLNGGTDVSRYYSVSGGNRGEQLITLQGDEKITGIWVDNGTKWGTGLSDTSGLTAPTVTDRLASSSLIGPDGVLRQDITVQQLLDDLGCTAKDLAEGRVAFALDDRGWVFGDKLVESLTNQVQVGTKTTRELVEAWDETVQELVKGPWDEVQTEVVKNAWDETVTKFAPELIGKAVAEGAAAGAGIGLIDQLHETLQTTYINGATPGRPNEVAPKAQEETISEMIKRLQSEQQEHDDERDDDDDRDL